MKKKAPVKIYLALSSYHDSASKVSNKEIWIVPLATVLRSTYANITGLFKKVLQNVSGASDLLYLSSESQVKTRQVNKVEVVRSMSGSSVSQILTSSSENIDQFCAKSSNSLTCSFIDCGARSSRYVSRAAFERA